VIDLDYLDEEDDDSYEEPIEGSPYHSFAADNMLDQLSVEDTGICPSGSFLFCALTYSVSDDGNEARRSTSNPR
jgi:hypothetical protein